MGVTDGKTGGITVIQRAGDALNLNPHFHHSVLDGVFTEERAGKLRFHRVSTTAIFLSFAKSWSGPFQKHWRFSTGSFPVPAYKSLLNCHGLSTLPVLHLVAQADRRLHSPATLDSQRWQ